VKEVSMRASGRESFEAWARARQQTLVRSAYLMTGDFQRAEDLVQEALIRAAERWDVLQAGSPDAWVRTVVYRQHVSWWRRTRHESTVERVPEGSSYADGEAGLLLRQALARLTVRQRAVVILRFVEDLSVTDAAATLGVTEGTIKKQTSVALAKLRASAPELEELEEERR
jgi:RNA polymerase sigma-70 factor (sigma-E family)